MEQKTDSLCLYEDINIQEYNYKNYNYDKLSENLSEIIPQKCSILDRSANGLRVIWRPDLNKIAHDFYKIEIGQLLAFRDLSSNLSKNFQWVIGMVRWMKCDTDNIVEFGIQFLSSRAIPIFIYNIKSCDEYDNKLGLLLPEVSNVNQPATIIISSLFGNSGDIITFYDVNQQYQKIELTQRFENSLAFTRFKFNLLESAIENQHVIITNSNNINAFNKNSESFVIEDKFKNLWSQL